jgi:hypothetical protein
VPAHPLALERIHDYLQAAGHGEDADGPLLRPLSGAPPEVKRLDAALEQAQSNALAMAIRVQEDAEWAIAPPPRGGLLQRLGGLIRRRAAPPTPETARAAVEGALPSAKPIVEKMIGIAGDPTNTAYQQAIKDYGPEVALFAAIRRDSNPLF